MITARCAPGKREDMKSIGASARASTATNLTTLIWTLIWTRDAA